MNLYLPREHGAYGQLAFPLVTAFGVAGVRKRGTKSRATPNDLWHLGSNTKAMTATLVARLIEQGQLSWDTTVADVFSDKDFEIHPDFRGVTLLQLLSHRAGLPPNLNLPDYLGADGGQESLRAVKQEPPDRASAHRFGIVSGVTNCGANPSIEITSTRSAMALSLATGRPVGRFPIDWCRDRVSDRVRKRPSRTSRRSRLAFRWA